MTTRHDTDWFRLVEASVDGELNEADERELREQMAQNDELRRLEQSLLEMRELVQTEVQVATDAAPLDGLWSRIEAQLSESEQSVDALTLQAFADGELAPAEAARVATRVAESGAERQRLEALSEMGGLLRASIDAAADEADFSTLWSRLDAKVGGEIEARGGFQTPAESPSSQVRVGWVERLLVAIGGYRSVAMSVAAAVAAVLVMWSVTGPDTGPDSDLAEGRPSELEIRVVHINEVRSDPGYNVTVDHPNQTAAPVIYIRPTPDASTPGPVEVRDQNNDGVHDNPI